MTIENIKNEVLGNIEDYVTNEAKTAFVGWFGTKVLPSIKEMADAYSTAVKETSELETGWVKFRDSLLIPGLISATLWLVEQAVNKTSSK